MKRFFLLLFLWSAAISVPGAQNARIRFLSLESPDSLHKARFWSAFSAGTLAYSATMAGLDQAWYADYPAGKFHFFNDMSEWNQMDKAGHFLMAYQESRWIYGGARWTGISPGKAAWVGFAGGQLVQTSFELFDGFSSQWGFSWADIGFNLLGSGLFLGQQLAWRDQRILVKMSTHPVRQSSEPIYAEGPAANGQWTTLQQRADALYGTGPFNLFVKNYNASVFWLSVNPRAFSADKLDWWPAWLNVAAGMGADNMFAGTGYTWHAEKDCSGPDCVAYSIDPDLYPRTRQFFLSFDVDYTRLGIRNRFLSALLSAVNIVKFPAPALEFTDQGRTRFHFVYF